MKTIITHFYNEEFLLPWWLEHHKKYFDFGILIDYHSTDNSVNIIKQICPHWQIVTSMNREFDAKSCDYEVSFYERQLSGWRVALNVTEFIVGDINNLLVESENRLQHIVPCVAFTDWNPDGILDVTTPLWEQIKKGVDYSVPALARRPRSIHNFNDMQYPLGRHFEGYTTDKSVIFHYANAICSKEMLARRLQIQEKISSSDKKENLGWHHHYGNQGLTKENLELLIKGFFSIGIKDCSELIKKLIV